MAVLKLKKDPKSATVSSKLTDEQNEKLDKLAQKHETSKSNLIAHLIEIGYLQFTGNKSF